ncbi:MAG: TonB-dependent receptor [Pseudomonadota bacterium]|nr:TonB-dependent receptor [Pseudomonadota bacterium]
MQRQSSWSVLLGFCGLLAAVATLADDSLEEIVVTASLRSTPAADLPQSITVLTHETLATAGVQHFQDVLGLIPDLNWASGTSRPRFFQLRGIGEVEQYQGAPNPSVGFLIDDIDFSGVGMPATLFDVAQIEVLRGPQGTTYGANALAGLISVRTTDPGDSPELHTEVTGGDYDTRSVGVAVGVGTASGGAGFRLVAQQFASDGFRRNAYLHDDSVNGFNEGTLRTKLHWQITDALRADLTLMRVRIDNGYDAWSVANSYTTYSNQPGRDAQLSTGAALRFSASIAGVGELRSVSSVADSKILYSFDGDWGNDALWGAYAPYDYFQSDHRDRRTIAEDLRLIGDAGSALFGRVRWLIGAYASRLTESDEVLYTFNDRFNGAGSSGLSSRYTATNVALYDALDMDIGSHGRLSAGLRFENRKAAYADSADVRTPFPTSINRMVGGNVSFEQHVGGENAYLTLARGYKGGGFNIGSNILSEQRGFGPETLWSAEAGLKSLDSGEALSTQIDAFYMQRRHMQVYLSQQLQPANPLAYVFYTQNASDGENYGLEGEARYRLGGGWQISGSGSLLRTRYLHVSGAFGNFGLDGRAQPFAPEYKLAAALEYQHPSGLFARWDVSAVGGFYYHTSDAQTSSAYNLENIRVGYHHAAWTASLCIRNVFDARYAQNGFYFGLIPPNFANQAFRDLGDPRQVGVTFSYSPGATAVR